MVDTVMVVCRSFWLQVIVWIFADVQDEFEQKRMPDPSLAFEMRLDIGQLRAVVQGRHLRHCGPAGALLL